MNIDDFFVTDGEHQTFKLDGTTVNGVIAEGNKSVNSKDKFVLVLDCDDLLVDISTKWLKKIKESEKLAHYVKCNTRVELRDTYYLNRWLNIEDSEHVDEFLGLYFNDPNFYEDLKPSPIMHSVLNILEYVEGIHILTSCGDSLTSPVTKSKLAWLKKYFGEALKGREDDIEFKIHIINTLYKDGKGGFLRDSGIKFNTFADDSLDNIYSVINNVKHVNKYELLIPILGFNHTLDPSRINSESDFIVQGAHNVSDISSEDFSAMLQDTLTLRTTESA